MLTDLLAAATAPAVPGPHDAYDWWSDIWLPAIVGVGSLAIAGIAVFVAMRSNRLARAATKAAERSNALARQALAHERDQAQEAQRRLEADLRAQFASRFLARFDDWLDLLESWDPDGARVLSELGAMDMETVSNNWFELELNDYAKWALHIETDGSDRVAALRRVRNAVHAVLSAWVRDPAMTEITVNYFDDWLKQQNSASARP